MENTELGETATSFAPKGWQQEKKLKRSGEVEDDEAPY